VTNQRAHNSEPADKRSRASIQSKQQLHQSGEGPRSGKAKTETIDRRFIAQQGAHLVDAVFVCCAGLRQLHKVVDCVE
jgi:hypothetical protein